MALTNTQIYYFDVSKIGRDFTGNQDISILYNEQALLESVNNILATEPGERVMYPDFGCSLSRYVFEPLDNITAADIRGAIVYAINRFEPRVKNLAVNVVPNFDASTFDIDVVFDLQVKSQTNNSQSISIKLNKIR